MVVDIGEVSCTRYHSLLKGALVHRKNAFKPFYIWLQIQKWTVLVVVGNPFNDLMDVCLSMVDTSITSWSFLQCRPTTVFRGLILRLEFTGPERVHHMYSSIYNE